MNKGLRHTVTSWVAILSFVAYSIVTPTFAYAQPIAPQPTADSASSTSTAVPFTIPSILGSCSELGLQITVPRLSLGLSGIAGENNLYIIDPTSRYRIWDNNLNGGSGGYRTDLQGTFLTTVAAANLVATLDSTQARWDADLRMLLGFNNTCYSRLLSYQRAEIASRDAQITALNEQMEERIQIHREHIEFLNDNIKPPKWYESGEFWFAMGLVGGVLITVGAGYAIGQASP